MDNFCAVTKPEPGYIQTGNPVIYMTVHPDAKPKPYLPGNTVILYQIVYRGN